MNTEWKPGCPVWTTENGLDNAETKRRSVLKRLVRKDYAKPPSAELVKSWHKEMFDGIAPHSDYVGQFRDEDRTSYCLQNYEVVVGDIPGTDSSRVLFEVEVFFTDFNVKLNSLEGLFTTGGSRPPTLDEVSGVVELAAWAHGEWVRIHPFANGNGRTARLLANYVLIRFGFGPALTIRPRPDQPYGAAARVSMKEGDHRLMEVVIWGLLAESYGLQE
jgi:fido (protein-threonine AMPylation protein)